MTGEQFDSGAVLSRARPVLTFSTLSRGERDASPGMHADTTPPPVCKDDRLARPDATRPPALPVIPRIVRRTMIDDAAFLRPVAVAAHVARRAGLGTLLMGALGLATLGVIAGLGMRSLSEETTIPSSSGAPATSMVHVADATAAEGLLARAPLSVRFDHATPPVHLEPAAPPRPAPAPVAHASAPPSHLTFASAHAAARKHPSTTALARR